MGSSLAAPQSKKLKLFAHSPLHFFVGKQKACFCSWLLESIFFPLPQFCASTCGCFVCLIFNVYIFWGVKTMDWYFLMDDIDCNWLLIKNASKPQHELCLFLRKLNLKL